MSNADRTIDASVSKAFFVEMLVKDISLEMAIHDLLDNCIDGALGLRGSESFVGLEVDITCLPDRFTIRDNCGGIDVEIARNYAFRFGRPPEALPLPYSVGRFGVGMKRAVFKLGRHFSVRSTTESHRFEVDVDVPSWEMQPEWQFEFSRMETLEEPIPLEERGSEVYVDALFDSVSERFQLESFVSRLKRQIESRHQVHLNRGLVVKVNGTSIVGTAVAFFETSGDLYPAFQQASYNGVVVRQIAGVGPRNPADAGWYLFCNGRMVLRADQSEVTGWGEANIERLPKYHNDFAWFRGCVFFDSEDPAALPWNTTKDGVDQDSGLYRSVRAQMIAMMTPVLAFLRDVVKEQEPDQPLTGLLSRASSIAVSQVQPRDTFYFRTPPVVPSEQRTTRIAYDRPQFLVNKVKQSLGVTTNVAVGQRTFDFYVDAEEIE